MSMHKLTDYLWSESQDLFSEALNTTFVKGIEGKNLDPQFFAKNLIQDAAYLAGLESIFGLLLARAVDEDEILRKYLESSHSELNEYNRSFVSTYRIQEPTGVRPLKSFQRCQDRKMTIVKEKDIVYSLIATLPCYRLWVEIARRLETCEQGNIYAFWIVDSKNELAVQTLKDLEDVINQFAHRAEESEALEIFRHFMQTEIDMFNLVDD